VLNFVAEHGESEPLGLRGAVRRNERSSQQNFYESALRIRDTALSREGLNWIQTRYHAGGAIPGHDVNDAAVQNPLGFIAEERKNSESYLPR